MFVQATALKGGDNVILSDKGKFAYFPMQKNIIFPSRTKGRQAYLPLSPGFLFGMLPTVFFKSPLVFLALLCGDWGLGMGTNVHTLATALAMSDCPLGLNQESCFLPASMKRQQTDPSA